MTALSIYHVDYRASDDYGKTVHGGRAGVCAANKTEAARLARERLSSDGWQSVAIKGIERVSPNDTDWAPGNVLVYF